MFDTIWSKFVSPELNEKFYVFLAETTNSNQVAKRTVGFHTLFGGTINPCEAKCQFQIDCFLKQKKNLNDQAYQNTRPIKRFELRRNELWNESFRSLEIKMYQLRQRFISDSVTEEQWSSSLPLNIGYIVLVTNYITEKIITQNQQTFFLFGRTLPCVRRQISGTVCPPLP